MTNTIDLIAASRGARARHRAMCALGPPARRLRAPEASSLNLLALDAVQRWLRIIDQGYSGVRAIEASRIVGAVDQSNDLERDFTGDGS